jgi:hypothetical protein
MKLIGILPVRNEDWVLGLSLRALLMWCDEVIVLDHASTDLTPHILSGIAEETGKVTVLQDSDPTWKEMAHRHRLLQAARAAQATHIAIVDADEVLTGNLLLRIRAEVQALSPGGLLRCGLPCITGSLDQYRIDGVFGERAETSIAFGDREDLAWYTQHDGYDFHHREPYGAKKQGSIPRKRGGLMHLQFVYRRRLVAKHALYKMTEVLRWPGREPVAAVEQRYNQAPDWSGMHTAQVPRAWWEPYEHLMQYIDITHEPWHETECRRLMAEHGPQRFAGLNLFGVA